MNIQCFLTQLASMEGLIVSRRYLIKKKTLDSKWANIHCTFAAIQRYKPGRTEDGITHRLGQSDTTVDTNRNVHRLHKRWGVHGATGGLRCANRTPLAQHLYLNQNNYDSLIARSLPARRHPPGVHGTAPLLLRWPLPRRAAVDEGVQGVQGDLQGDALLARHRRPGRPARAAIALALSPASTSGGSGVFAEKKTGSIVHRCTFTRCIDSRFHSRSTSHDENDARRATRIPVEGF